MLLEVIFVSCTFGHVISSCPHQRELKKWSETSTWGDDGKPTEGESVTISEGILMDESPPELYNITILSTGSLVFDPTVDIKIRVANIYVYGSFEIGSEECLYDGILTITLIGNRESHAGEKESKVILVNEGGTIEIHGPPKLSWTKLDKTLIANHENEDIEFEHVRNETNMAIRPKNNGISAYTITMKNNTPVVKQYGMYDIVWHGLELEQQINAVEEGDILMMATKKRLRNAATAKAPPKVYAALEMLVYGEVTDDSMLRDVDDKGSTWAFVFQKGNNKSLAEETNPLGVDSYARFQDQDSGLVFSAEAYGHKNPNAQTNNFRIGTIDDIYPKLTLIDDVTTWQPGDKVVIASTDYHWAQAEEVDVILCTDCAPNQVRIDALLKYQHFGALVSEAIDMRAEVAVLTRTVVIEGEVEEGCPTYNGNCNTIQAKGLDTFGAHIKILKGYNNSRIENIELRNVGQQTDLGRYPVHWHMAFDKKESAAVPYARGLSIHDTFARCVTIHGTHGVRVENNVCYNHMGHGYFLEDGGEKNTVFDGNLAMTARRGTGFLEPTDQRPTGFWITNPQTYFSNNVAAGGEGTGIWFIFPEQPLGPSKAYNLMEPGEARRTACPLLYNNVAHSNIVMGIHIGHKLKDDRRFECCNIWQPRADPKDPSSEPLMIPMDKITAYKNRNNNAWLEGGLLNVTRVSVSDSTNGLLVSNDGLANDFGGRCSHSVVIGESINRGVPTAGFDRSLPYSGDNAATVQSGLTTWKGPVAYSDMWFDGFQSNSHYDIAAIAKKRASPYFFPILTSFTDTLFAFDDGPGLGTYTLSGTKQDRGWEENKDGELSAGFILKQNIPGKLADRFYVVKADAFSAAAEDCILRPNWRMAICETKYANLRIRSSNLLKTIVFVRDDVPSAQLEFNMEVHTGPMVVVDGSRSYTVHFEEEMAKSVSVKLPGLDMGDSVRVGVCTPLGAEWDIRVLQPYRLRRKDELTEVPSLAELDRVDDLDGQKYYYDWNTGMVYYKFINTEMRDPDETTACNGGRCPEIIITISSGDRTDADCRTRLYTSEQLSMTLPTLPEFNEPLYANGGPIPPAGYGAGSTRPFLERPRVDGGFSDWSKWSSCSRTCAGGEQFKTRQCNNPLPENGGNSCQGSAVETRVCNDGPC